MRMAQEPAMQTVKITIDIPMRVSEILKQEAALNRRSRKKQLELAIEQHAERFERRQQESVSNG